MNAVFADKVVDTMLAEVDHQVHEGDPLRLALLRLHLGAPPGRGGGGGGLIRF